MSKKPSVLYYHHLAKSLSDGIFEQCTKQNNLVIRGNINWDSFTDHWPNLFIDNVKKDCAGRDVIFVGSLHSPDIIFEQISILYSLPRYLSRSVTFILPYFPTATMERIETEGAVATASTLARILSAVPLSSRGPCQIIMFDIHALQERFYFGDNVIPRLESAIPLLLKRLECKDLFDVSIVFPDEGAFKRFHSYFKNYPQIICTKIRDGDNRVVKIKEGDASGRHCVIVDDLVMSGGTLLECARALKNTGASQISSYVTHAVFPNDSWKKFLNNTTPFYKFFITDSIPYAYDISKHSPFELLSLASLLSDVLLGYDLVQD